MSWNTHKYYPENQHKPTSIETTVVEARDTTLGEFIVDHNAESPVNLSTAKEFPETTQENIQSLTACKIKVLRICLGINKNTDRSLEEVGKPFDVTLARIRQTETKA